MTTKQRIHLMTLWRDACETQGWNPNDSDRRHDIYHHILGTEKRFANFTNADFDRAKSHFLFLADNITGAIETDHPDQGESRRLRYKIDELILCLSLYVAADPYVASIMRDKFHTPSIDSLTVAQLHQLIFTINARLSGARGFRSQAGHSIHDMLTKAGLACHCRQCSQRDLLAASQTNRDAILPSTSDDPF